MAILRTTGHKFLDLFVVPLWVGLLTLPFTGIGSAIRVTVSAVIAMLLWRMLRTDVVSDVRSLGC